MRLLRGKISSPSFTRFPCCWAWGISRRNASPWNRERDPVDASTRAHISMGVSYLGASTSAGKGEHPRLIQRSINVWSLWEGRAPARPQTARLWTRAQRITSLPSRPLMGRGETIRVEVKVGRRGTFTCRTVRTRRSASLPGTAVGSGVWSACPPNGARKNFKKSKFTLDGGGCEYCKICVGALGEKATDARVGAVQVLFAPFITYRNT